MRRSKSALSANEMRSERMKWFLVSIALIVEMEVIANPVTLDDSLYLVEEQVWIEVGPKSSEIVATFSNWT